MKIEGETGFEDLPSLAEVYTMVMVILRREEDLWRPLLWFGRRTLLLDGQDEHSRQLPLKDH